MASVVLSKEAQRDLRAIRDYIRGELANPCAARDTITALRNTISSLQAMPERGIPLDKVLPVQTDFRFLICKNYRVFYLFQGDVVEVVRILHTLQDYMRALFS